MDTWDKFIYALNLGILLAGLRLLFMWGHTSKLLGLGLVSISLLMLYINYIKDKKDVAVLSHVNMRNASLGLFLIFIDVSYNLYIGDAFRYFDYGMLLSGLFIILLNMNVLGFLKLDKEMIYFTTYFIFILMLALIFLSTGITFIYNFIYASNSSKNPFYILMTNLAVKNSAFFLDLIKPTTLIENTIDFDGFKVGIAYPCSGIESMTVFLSAVIAYFVAIKEKNVKKIFIGTIMGIVILYFINILRIIIITSVGYYMGTEAMHFTHNNLGWIMFVMGMFVFWYLVFE